MPLWDTDSLHEMFDRKSVSIDFILRLFDIDPVEARRELEAALASNDTIDDVLNRLDDGMTLIPKPEYAAVPGTCGAHFLGATWEAIMSRCEHVGECGCFDLPPDKTCNDCGHMSRCRWLLSRNGEERTCDWAPSRFLPIAPRTV